MALEPKLLEILACPEDKGPLLNFADEDSLYNPRMSPYVSHFAGTDLMIAHVYSKEIRNSAEGARSTSPSPTLGRGEVRSIEFLGERKVSSLYSEILNRWPWASRWLLPGLWNIVRSSGFRGEGAFA